MIRLPRNRAIPGLILLVGGLFSCQNESNFAPIPIENPGTTFLTGTVTAAGGPLVNAIVTLEPVVDNLPVSIQESLASGVTRGSLTMASMEALGIRAAVSDERGRYAFASVEPGIFQLEARGRDHLGATSRVTIGPFLGALAETTLVDIQLTPTGDYYGIVTLETATSHQGTLVAVDGTSQVAVTNPAGSYVIEGVPVGNHLVRAMHAGYHDRTANGMLSAAGDSIPLLSLVLPRDSNIAPVAVANAPTNTFTGQPTGFSGTGTDKDGTVVLYEWDFDDDGTYDYSSPTSATTTFVFNTDGTYQARLRVLDDDGAIGVDVVSFTISEGAVYVATTGSNANPGTAAAPVATIGQGISLAQPNGLEVRVAGGTYNEVVVLASDVSIIGGYNSVTWVRDLPNQVTQMIGSTSPVQGTSVQDLELDGLTIISTDATVAGTSSYGIYLMSCQSITVRDCLVRGGRGANGTAGNSGSNGGTGASGSTGAPGCENGGTFCGTCSQPPGGSGGFGFYSGTNISGGTGGLPGLGPQNGSVGQPGQGPGPGIGGSGAPCSGCGGQFGQPGQPGLAGFNGSAGSTFGSASLSGYVVSSGASGGTGQPGSGGGGGGGGGGGTSDCDSYGSSGGGGGAGGLPGAPGTNGTGAGGSFAIWAFNCTNVSVIASDLETVGGGSGGAGGVGGTGGNGGNPGLGGPYGGSGEQDDAGNGAAGGAGGKGGNGGHGGGGGGGPSIGIAASGTTGLSMTSVTFTLASGGSGGTSSGNPGAAGLMQNTWP